MSPKREGLVEAGCSVAIDRERVTEGMGHGGEAQKKGVPDLSLRGHFRPHNSKDLRRSLLQAEEREKYTALMQDANHAMKVLIGEDGVRNRIPRRFCPRFDS